jgi:hypothetical protein
MSCHGNKRASLRDPGNCETQGTWDSSLSGIFAGCVQAARALGVQVIADMSVTVVVR